MLYAKGVFINRCFDALNLTDGGRVTQLSSQPAGTRGPMSPVWASEAWICCIVPELAVVARGMIARTYSK
jgi:hypothetical protein